MKTRMRIGIVLSGIVFCGFAWASSCKSGAGRNRSAKKPAQYKKQNRNAIAQIVAGEHDEAIAHFDKYLNEHPDDLESFYGLAIAYAQKNDLRRALKYVGKAVDAGLPFERFQAGPRDLMQPLTESAGFKKLASKHAVELLHGPVVGCVTDRSAKFWVRTANEVSVQVVVGKVTGGSPNVKSDIVKTRSDRDFTAVVAVNGLQPDTDYAYELLIDGAREKKTWKFRTFPSPGSKARFQVGFGGGAGYTPIYERMWNTVHSHNLPAFLLLGDNVYIDHPTIPQVQQYCYYRRQSRPEYRRFAAATSVFAIWDDHDFVTNDKWGGPEIEVPEWKIPVWRVFRNNWNNPYYGGGETQPGCWFDFSIADVDFFMLDGRYYRTSPKVDNPAMLGPVQKKWFLEKLKASTATFKVLASPVPWTPKVKPGSRDTWDGYAEEREEIFSFIEKNRIDGIILISADRHRSDARKIDREKGYDLYEFESSKLTNIHTHKVVAGAIFGYNEKCSFGVLTFDTTKSDPEVTYEIFNIDDELIHSLTLKHSQLEHTK